jgi:NAD(P)H-dependent FMN reductase
MPNSIRFLKMQWFDNGAMYLLAISGSLRAGSSNTAALLAMARLAPANVVVHLFDGIGDLPHFNPDHDKEGMQMPEPVARLRDAVAQANGLIISSPEYAHGIPGSLKNALDWLASSTDFAGKPAMLLNISPISIYVHAQLIEVLKTMSAEVCADGACTIPMPRGRHDMLSMLNDDGIAPALRNALNTFADAVERNRHSQSSE